MEVFVNILKLLTLIFILLSIFIWGNCIRNGKRGYYIAVFLYSINAFIFQVFRFFNLLSTTAHVIWGQLLVFHSVMIMFSLGYILYKRTQGGTKKWTLH